MSVITLAYGKTGLTIERPPEAEMVVLGSKFLPGLPNPRRAIQRSLHSPIESPPLRDVVKATGRVGIVFNDITRPTPTPLILPLVLNELAHVPIENITLFNALGTHRSNSHTELCDMLGENVVDRYCIVQNNAFDSSTQVCLGTTTRGHEIWLNRQFVECDVRILIGSIEPHFFAGFSGGGKAVMPGMAGQRTVLGNHDAGMIGDSQATWGITWGNPIWEEIHEVALRVEPNFLLNVALNRDQQITGIFAGDLVAAHEAGCAFVKQTAMTSVTRPFDIVITSNSGYPLDLNLYQSVKGMSAAAQVVREGGAIIIGTNCWDGIPDHGFYGQLLQEARSPKDLLERIYAPGFLEQDQWQAQIQAQIQLKAEVYVYSHNLTDEQIERALLEPSPSIEETVDDLLKKLVRKARICVLPEGPHTIPYLKP